MRALLLLGVCQAYTFPLRHVRGVARTQRPLARSLSLRSSASPHVGVLESKHEGRRGEWERLRSLIGRDWVLLLFAGVFLVCAAVADVAIPHFSSQALNAIVAKAQGEPRSVRPAITGLIVASGCAALFTGLRGAAFWVAGTRVVSRLRAAMFENMLSQELAYFDQVKRGELTSRLSSDATKVADVVSFNLNILARQTIQAVGGVCYLFWLDAKLACVAVSWMVLAGVLTDFYGRFARSYSRKSQDAIAKAQGVADEAVEQVRVVRALGAENKVAAQYARAVAIATSLQQAHGVGYGVSRVALGLARAGSTAAILAFGEQRRAAGFMDAERLVSFVFYSAFVNGAAFDVGDQLAKVEEALGAGAAAFDVAARRPRWKGKAPPSALSVKTAALDERGVLVRTTVERDTAKTVEKLGGSVHVDNVTFSYPARPGEVALANVTISVPAGKKVALVGQSGSGKSSIIRLILRQYEVENGSIKLDGVDVKDVHQSELTRRVAYVEQEPRLFDGSIADNIKFGLADDDPLATDDKVVDAAQRAGVSEFADRLPAGLDTRVGAAGSFVSGGQKSRIAIARALLRNPDLIVLDEPTSALREPVSTDPLILSHCCAGMPSPKSSSSALSTTSTAPCSPSRTAWPQSRPATASFASGTALSSNKVPTTNSSKSRTASTPTWSPNRTSQPRKKAKAVTLVTHPTKKITRLPPSQHRPPSCPSRLRPWLTRTPNQVPPPSARRDISIESLLLVMPKPELCRVKPAMMST